MHSLRCIVILMEWSILCSSETKVNGTIARASNNQGRHSNMYFPQKGKLCFKKWTKEIKCMTVSCVMNVWTWNHKYIGLAVLGTSNKYIGTKCAWNWYIFHMPHTTNDQLCWILDSSDVYCTLYLHISNSWVPLMCMYKQLQCTWSTK